MYEQVSGKVGEVAGLPTGSRVADTCRKISFFFSQIQERL
jgi:hypothetical protein